MHDTDIPLHRLLPRIESRSRPRSKPRLRHRLPLGFWPWVQFRTLLATLTLVLPGTTVLYADNEQLPQGAVTISEQVTETTRSQAPDTPPNSGMLMLGTATRWYQALLLDTHITLDVQGLLADMTVQQRFTNDSEQWLEGKYLFPLAADAAVRGLTVTVGERRITGQVMPRAKATERFNQARDSGQLASLVEQQRPNLFMVRVASIAPGEEVRVELDVMLPVTVADNLYSLVLPTTVTPRYVNSATPDAPGLQAPAAHSDRIRGPGMNLSMAIAAVNDLDSVRSSTHDLTAADGRLVLTDALMDRDVILTWKPPVNDSPEGDLFISEHQGKRYVQMLLMPPDASLNKISAPPRELVLIIDRSGSMAGQSMRAAREALQVALGGLNEDDFFNIIAFDDSTEALFSASRPADATHIKSARQFVRGLHADGGTEMRAALDMAMTSADVDRLRQIVFITDGSVGYENELLRQINKDIGISRLFTIGIGTAPNHFFLDKAAAAGRGTSLSIASAGDVQETITTLLTRLQHPVLTDLSVQFIGGSGDLVPGRLPDLYADQPLMIVARIDDSVTGLTLAADHAGERWQRSMVVSSTTPSTAPAAQNGQQDPPTTDTPGPSTEAIAMYWARQKISSLMDEQRVAENTELHRERITRLALDAGVVSAYTSYVAVEEAVSRPANRAWQSAQVTSLMPAGNLMQAIVMPAGAAGSDTLAMWSAVLALFGLIMLWLTTYGAFKTVSGRTC